MKHKQILAGLLATLLLCGSLPMATLAADIDYATRGEIAEMLLHAADAYHPGVEKSDILKGRADGSLDETGTATRAEAFVMLQRAFGDLPTPVGDNARSGYPASDFTDIPAWAKTALDDVLSTGIVAGTSATTFSPNARVTTRQMELMIDRVYALQGSNLKDDFFATINKKVLDTGVILPGRQSGGTFDNLQFKADTSVAKIITEIATGTPKNEGERKIATLYHNILDQAARDKAGIAPLAPYLTAIDSAKTLEELMAADNRMATELGVSTLLGFALAEDAKDSTAYGVGFSTFTPTLGQAGYANATPGQKAAYLQYITTLLTLSGVKKAEAEAQVIWEMETKLAAAMLTPQEAGDVDKIYHVYTMAQLRALFPAVDLDAVYKTTGFPATDKLFVFDEGLLNVTAPLFTDANLPLLKMYSRLNLVSSFGDCLDHRFADASAAFGQAYFGIEGTEDAATVAAATVQSMLPEYLGEAYVARSFSPAAKADVERIVGDIIAAYKERLQGLDWMSDVTKTRALHKLDTMTIHVGYPDKWEDDLDGVVLKTAAEGGSYFDNVVTLCLADAAQAPELLREPVDRQAWLTSPYTVNAFYAPTYNSIEFPAGILQPPFYDVNASYEENLGGIGFVIGHEITHAFDNSGAKFDETGNAADWWTPADYAAFQKKCDAVVAYYDGQESAPGIRCDGALTLSENIADLGSAACLTSIVAKRANPDFKALYTGMAEIWALYYPREMRIYLSQTDVHAANKLRTNRVLQSCDSFYQTFDIQPGDGMYLAPEARVTIW
ncbi:MAG: M13 family metallopeptidase [Oscillospiraceae bacterium]